VKAVQIEPERQWRKDLWNSRAFKSGVGALKWGRWRLSNKRDNVQI